MSFLPVHGNFVVSILLRLDYNSPTGWECGIVYVELVGLERKASENRCDGQDLTIG